MYTNFQSDIDRHINSSRTASFAAQMSSGTFLSPRAKENLTLELSLLHILHHRNKNQHHLQPFFKHLSILKRTLGHLLESPESGYLLQRIRGVVVPFAWEEFSRVVA